MTEFFTAADGTRLAFDRQGEGTALLCLPGLTRNRADFDYVRPYLTGVQVIRMDYRGRGSSAWSGAASYTVLQEAQDAMALLDHLGIARAAIMGTSRGGLIGLFLAHLAKLRLLGLCLNDIGPVVERGGVERIATYIGRRPLAHDLVDYAHRLAQANPGFANVPDERWLAEAAHQVRATGDGLQLSYDPALREAFTAGMQAPSADLWPLFDLCIDLPVAVIRGANSDLLSAETLTEMQRRHPDLIQATVPDRGHVPFLDEPESLAGLRAFLKALP